MLQVDNFDNILEVGGGGQKVYFADIIYTTRREKFEKNFIKSIIFIIINDSVKYTYDNHPSPTRI